MTQGQTTNIIFTALSSGLTWSAEVAQNGGNLQGCTGTFASIGGTSYTFTASPADTDAAELYFLFSASDGTVWTTGTIFTHPSPLTFEAGWTLAEIIGKAQSRIDQMVLLPSGKFSLPWWVDIVNSVQSIAASETGYKRTPLYVTVNANSQSSDLPVSMCKNIRSVWIGNQQIVVKTDFDLNESVGCGWRQLSNFPNQPRGSGVNVSAGSGDTAQVTLTGTDSNGLYQTSTFSLLGATPVGVGVWGELYSVTLSAPCAGTVRLFTTPAGTTIITLAPGQMSAGQTQSTGLPQYVVLDPPSMYWYPVPDQNYTATVFASAMPVDFITPADLTSDPLSYVKPDSFPVAYQDILVDGAVAMSELGDLYSSSQSARESQELQGFWSRINKLSDFIDAMSADRQEPVGVSPEGNYQERFSSRRRW